MKEDLVVGVIYSNFHEKQGPIPAAWTPKSINTVITNIISTKSLNITGGGGRGASLRTLAIIPFSKFELKSLTKFFELQHVRYRGGANDCTLNLVFKDTDDLIFYRYIKEFEPLFNKTAKMIIELEQNNAGRQQLEETLVDFKKGIENLLSNLHRIETETLETDEFPLKADQKDQKMFRFKIILCGDKEVGKTSIAIRFTNKAFRRTYIPTIGVNITEKIKKQNGTAIEFIIWDVAGQAKFQRFRKHYYQGADGLFLVFDLTNEESFQNISRWYQDITYHIGKIHGYLLGNKSDLEKTVPNSKILTLADSLNIPYIETSALTGENIDESFFKLAKILSQAKNQKKLLALSNEKRNHSNSQGKNF